MTEKIDALILALKSLKRETLEMKKTAADSADCSKSHKSKMNAHEKARMCAVEIRRFKSLAHEIAVEIGIADKREKSGAQTAPAGFGREMQL